jgi:hypothetical protein
VLSISKLERNCLPLCPATYACVCHPVKCVSTALDPLHQAGWSIGSTPFAASTGGPVWVVGRRSGESVIMAEDSTETSWRAVVDQARALDAQLHRGARSADRNTDHDSGCARPSRPKKPARNRSTRGSRPGDLVSRLPATVKTLLGCARNQSAMCDDRVPPTPRRAGTAGSACRTGRELHARPAWSRLRTRASGFVGIVLTAAIVLFEHGSEPLSAGHQVDDW